MRPLLFFFIFISLVFPGALAYETPPHDSFKLMNNRTVPEGLPLDIPLSSQATIKNAWVKIFTVGPGVEDVLEDKYYIAANGTVFFTTGYAVELPQGGGDCGNQYQEVSHSSQPIFYINGAETARGGQGARSLDFEVQQSEDGEANARLELKIEHTYRELVYSWVSKCGKKICWEECEHTATNTYTDTLTISDEELYYWNILSPELYLRRDIDRERADFGYLEIQTETPNRGLSFKTEASELDLNTYSYDMALDLYPFEGGIIPAYYITAAPKYGPQAHTKGFFISDPSHEPRSSSFYFTMPQDLEELNITLYNILGEPESHVVTAAEPPGANLTAEIEPRKVEPGAAFTVTAELEGPPGKEIIFTYGEDVQKVTTGADGRAQATFTQKNEYRGLVFVIFKGDRDLKAASAVVPFAVSGLDLSERVQAGLFFILVLLILAALLSAAINNKTPADHLRYIGFVLFLIIIIREFSDDLVILGFLLVVDYIVFIK